MVLTLTKALVSKTFHIKTTHCCVDERPTRTIRLLYLGLLKLSSDTHTNKNTVVISVLIATDLLSCQVVQVGQLLLTDLEVPEKKQGNRRFRTVS